MSALSIDQGYNSFMDDRIHVTLELPGETVVLDVPKVKRTILPFDISDRPTNMTYDTGAIPITDWVPPSDSD